MSKSRIMGAGLAGSTQKVYNVNVNQIQFGDRLQGLPPTTGKSSNNLREINQRSFGNKRDFVFCVNQLGGVGGIGGSRMFLPNADGVSNCEPGPYQKTNTSNNQNDNIILDMELESEPDWESEAEPENERETEPEPESELRVINESEILQHGSFFANEMWVVMNGDVYSFNPNDESKLFNVSHSLNTMFEGDDIYKYGVFDLMNAVNETISAPHSMPGEPSFDAMLADSFTKIGKYKGAVRYYGDIQKDILSTPIQVSIVLADNPEEKCSVTTSLGELIDNVILKATLQLGVSHDTKPRLIDQDDNELEFGKTLMESDIKAGAELKLIKVSSSEILSFTYNVNEGLDTRMSSYTSVPAFHDTVYYNTAKAVGNTVLKENMYRTEIIENQNAECDGKMYNINATYTYTFESTEENLQNVYENKLNEKKGIYIKEGVYGTSETLIRVCSDSKTRTYYSTQPIENTYLYFPEESNDESIEAYATNSDMFQIMNIGDGDRDLVVEF